MNFPRFFVFLVSMIACGSTVLAQQEPQFSQNMFNQLFVNPGHAGMNNAICVTGLMRQQWVGFVDAEGNRLSPETFLFAADALVPVLKGGVGGVVVQDKIGYYTTNSVKLSYSYHKLISDGTLGMGIQLGFDNHLLDAGKFKPIDDTDPILSKLKGSDLSNMMFDLGMGLYYQKPGRYYVGFSATRLLQSSKQIGQESGMNINYRRHYFLSAGYHLRLGGDQKVELTPSLFVKSDGATVQADVNALMSFNQKFWGGMSFRPQDAIVLMFGFSLNELRIGYSYDVPVSAVGASGSHEVFLSYCFRIEVDKIKKSYRNPRYL